MKRDARRRPLTLATLTTMAAAALAGVAPNACAAAPDAPPVAVLLRVTENGAPLNRNTVTTFSVETAWMDELEAKGYAPIDLSEIHTDFQTLKTQGYCAVTGEEGATATACATSDSYAEASLSALENIGAYAGRIDKLRPLLNGGYILIGDASAVDQGRDLTGGMFYRVVRFCDSKVVGEDYEPLARRYGTRPKEFVVSMFFEELVLHSATTVADSINRSTPTCP
ncbi:MAG: hypothetical protein AAGC56_01200 [Pseudomonadota bacterium]